MKTAEKKYRTATAHCNSTYDTLWKAYPLNHNSLVSSPIFDNVAPNSVYSPLPSQGDKDEDRNGDEIYAKGIMYRATINVPNMRKNATFKLLQVEWNSTQGSPITYGDLLHNITGSVALDPIQTDRWSVKTLGTYRVTARDVGAGDVSTINIKKWIPFKRKLTFKQDDSIVVCKGMKEYVALIWMSWDIQSTLTTDTIGYVKGAYTLHYGDP